MYHVSFDLDFKRNTFPGKLIVLEGIDGSGKTTQVSLVVDALEKQGKKAIATKEPTDGPIGKFIRSVLAGEMDVSLVGFQYLFVADRVEHQEKIFDLLKKGYFVICDRYFWSSIAYGLADREGVDFHNQGEVMLVAQSILSMYHQFLIPDATFHLQVSPEVGLARLSGMEKKKEIYENTEKLVKIERGYQWLLEQFPREFTTIDAEKSVEKVTEEIVGKVESIT